MNIGKHVQEMYAKHYKWVNESFVGLRHPQIKKLAKELCLSEMEALKKPVVTTDILLMQSFIKHNI
jgi:hypothetical protein